MDGSMEGGREGGWIGACGDEWLRGRMDTYMHGRADEARERMVGKYIDRWRGCTSNGAL